MLIAPQESFPALQSGCPAVGDHALRWNLRDVCYPADNLISHTVTHSAAPGTFFCRESATPIPPVQEITCNGPW
jgi:hypothetical protein